MFASRRGPTRLRQCLSVSGRHRAGGFGALPGSSKPPGASLAPGEMCNHAEESHLILRHDRNLVLAFLLADNWDDNSNRSNPKLPNPVRRPISHRKLYPRANRGGMGGGAACRNTCMMACASPPRRLRVTPYHAKAAAACRRTRRRNGGPKARTVHSRQAYQESRTCEQRLIRLWRPGRKPHSQYALSTLHASVFVSLHGPIGVEPQGAIKRRDVEITTHCTQLAADDNRQSERPRHVVQNGRNAPDLTSSDRVQRSTSSLEGCRKENPSLPLQCACRQLRQQTTRVLQEHAHRTTTEHSTTPRQTRSHPIGYAIRSRA